MRVFWEGQKSPSEVLAVCFRGADVEGEGEKVRESPASVVFSKY